MEKLGSGPSTPMRPNPFRLLASVVWRRTFCILFLFFLAITTILIVMYIRCFCHFLRALFKHYFLSFPCQSFLYVLLCFVFVVLLRRHIS